MREQWEAEEAILLDLYWNAEDDDFAEVVYEELAFVQCIMYYGMAP